jgi:hypothetical protein
VQHIISQAFSNAFSIGKRTYTVYVLLPLEKAKEKAYEKAWEKLRCTYVENAYQLDDDINDRLLGYWYVYDGSAYSNQNRGVRSNSSRMATRHG